VFAHSLICICYRTYEIHYCSLFLSFHLKVDCKGVESSKSDIKIKNLLTKKKCATINFMHYTESWLYTIHIIAYARCQRITPNHRYISCRPAALYKKKLGQTAREMQFVHCIDPSTYPIGRLGLYNAKFLYCQLINLIPKNSLHILLPDLCQRLP
jgi:hypothetical protein